MKGEGLRWSFAMLTIISLIQAGCSNSRSDKNNVAIAVLACGDAITQPQLRDGRCTPGQNGDIALQVNLTLQDKLGTEYDADVTNPNTGEATLSSVLPNNFTPVVGYSHSIPSPVETGIEGFLIAPEESGVFKTVNPDGSIRVENPYVPDITPDNSSSG